MHWMLSPEPEKPVLIVPLVEDLMSQDEFLNGPDSITWLRSKLVVTHTDIQNVNITMMMMMIVIITITIIIVTITITIIIITIIIIFPLFKTFLAYFHPRYQMVRLLQ